MNEMNAKELLYVSKTIHGSSINNILKDENEYYSNFNSYIQDKISRDEYSNKLVNLIENKLEVRRNFYLKSHNYLIELKKSEEDVEKLDDDKFLMETYADYHKWLYENIDIESYPVEIHLRENNEIILYEGIHRTLICCVKNIKLNYVLKSESKEYESIMEKLKYDSENLYHSDELILYNPIEHLFFSEYKVIRDDRRELIFNCLNNLDLNNGLEIGPQNGCMSFYLSKRDLNMTAIEYEKDYFQLCENIEKLTNVHVNFVFTSIYDFDMSDKSYDFVVGLSIFYHLYRNDKNACISLLNLIKTKTKYLILDDEPNTQIFTENDIRELFENSTESNKNVEKIYTGTDNRNIYLIRI